MTITEKDEDFSSEGLNFGYLVFEILDGTESPHLDVYRTSRGNHWWKESPRSDLAFQPIRHRGKLWG